jgi:hypothetical protein
MKQPLLLAVVRPPQADSSGAFEWPELLTAPNTIQGKVGRYVYAPYGALRI